MNLTLNAGQLDALESVRNWDFHKLPILTLFGHAGTGKSTIAPQALAILAEHGLVEVRAMALSGKAAAVMRRKGFPDATTIHKVMYRWGLAISYAEATPV